ncbi:hypothetical protein MHM89_11305 [Pseudoalteromonas sp. CNC9-20]|uniref:hypothetical protein n=1 Tax=Pseudoalteromonas sp. CNC9-20 TaxID=2917750 RepID=UPI001EF4A651|nr:hypothetical protein [Pseudoalteromonas sp. CNC9-20]MCG7570519.1 hypothetical protein [Pseudoalteromonas sp. CNC9-20]
MKLFDSAGVAAAITAYLYCASTAFNHGYLNTLGLDSDLLERSFHQTIYSGLILSLSNFLWLTLGIFCLTVLHFLWQELKDLIGSCTRLTVFLSKVKNKLGITNKKTETYHKKYEARVMTSLGVLLSFIGVSLVLMSHESKGADMAHKILDKVHDQSAATMKSEDYENDLVFLYCGTNNCAGYDPIKKRVVYLPQQILSIQTSLGKQ